MCGSRTRCRMATHCKRQRGSRKLLIRRMSARVPAREPRSRSTAEGAEIAEEGSLCVPLVLRGSFCGSRSRRCCSQHRHTRRSKRSSRPGRTLPPGTKASRRSTATATGTPSSAGNRAALGRSACFTMPTSARTTISRWRSSRRTRPSPTTCGRRSSGICPRRHRTTATRSGPGLRWA